MDSSRGSKIPNDLGWNDLPVLAQPWEVERPNKIQNSGRAEHKRFEITNP